MAEFPLLGELGQNKETRSILFKCIKDWIGGAGSPEGNSNEEPWFLLSQHLSQERESYE